MEVPGLKPGDFFPNLFLCTLFFYFSVTVLLEYLDHTFFMFGFALYVSPWLPLSVLSNHKGLHYDSNFMYRLVFKLFRQADYPVA